MRIKADALGLEVQDYKNDKVDYSELYTGFLDISVSKEILEEYSNSGKISLEKLDVNSENLTPNCFIRMNCENDFVTGRYANGKVRKIILGDIEAWGLRARNEEQRFAMELLMDEAVKVVTLVGGAGTGKFYRNARRRRNGEHREYIRSITPGRYLQWRCIYLAVSVKYPCDE